MIKKILSAALCAALGITLCGCGKSKENAPAYQFNKTVEISDSLKIARKPIGDKPMGDFPRTVFVYMSGSDLESGSVKASDDIEEMVSSTEKNVRFIVQTGGTDHPPTEYFSTENNLRWEISGGKAKKISEQKLTSMASPTTLRDFLSWGVENYPAAKMDLIFWGHGKGTVGGLCKDDNFSEYLSLADLNAALSEVASKMTDKFELIGFDCCYMATIETADIAANYADYMIASEEMVPNDGWNYTALGNLLESDPSADFSEISKTICDSAFEGFAESEVSDIAAMSAIDLSKLDEVIISLDEFAKKQVNFSERKAVSDFESSLRLNEHYGSDSGFNGYSNFFDLGELAKSGEAIAGASADEVLSAIENAVLYKRANAMHKNAAGLTVYYPLEPQGLKELEAFAKLCVSPHYLAFVDKKLQASSPAAKTADYSAEKVTKAWCDYQNKHGGEIESCWGSPVEEQNENKRYKSTAVKFAEDLKFENGSYSLTLFPESISKTACVGLEVYNLPEKIRSYRYGLKLPEAFDWSTGKFSDSFKGDWLSIGGTPIQIKPVWLEKDGSSETLTQFSVEDNIFCARISEPSGYWNDDFLPLPESDINAVYDECMASTDKFGTIPSENKGRFSALSTAALPDGDYLCCVLVTDIYGDCFQSRRYSFSISDGTMNFTAE